MIITIILKITISIILIMIITIIIKITISITQIIIKILLIIKLKMNH